VPNDDDDDDDVKNRSKNLGLSNVSNGQINRPKINLLRQLFCLILENGKYKVSINDECEISALITAN
jgi:hypothetical protein